MVVGVFTFCDRDIYLQPPEVKSPTQFLRELSCVLGNSFQSPLCGKWTLKGAAPAEPSSAFELSFFLCIFEMHLSTPQQSSGGPWLIFHLVPDTFM